MAIADIEEQVRDFLLNNFIFDQAVQLGPDESAHGE